MLSSSRIADCDLVQSQLPLPSLLFVFNSCLNECVSACCSVCKPNPLRLQEWGQQFGIECGVSVLVAANVRSLTPAS